ncbi:hypothetical protein FRAHR75_690021 [Frankia sp. Hr75.2]|nr:hypothetical protein FRAHR75_690021 [Frankia sp. Hr75.2]
MNPPKQPAGLAARPPGVVDYRDRHRDTLTGISSAHAVRSWRSLLTEMMAPTWMRAVAGSRPRTPISGRARHTRTNKAPRRSPSSPGPALDPATWIAEVAEARGRAGRGPEGRQAELAYSLVTPRRTA